MNLWHGLPARAQVRSLRVARPSLLVLPRSKPRVAVEFQAVRGVVEGAAIGIQSLKLLHLLDGLPPAHWLPSVFKVSGLCETAYPPLVGISLPGWSLIGFVLAFIALASSLWRRRRAR